MLLYSTIQNALVRKRSASQPELLSLISFLLLLVYAFSRTGFPSIAKFSLIISGLLGLWCLYKYGRDVKSHQLFVFVFASVLIQTISWALALMTQPNWAEDNLKIEYLTRFMIFIPMAWWVAQFRNGIWWLFASVALGVLFSPWISGYGYQEFLDGFHGGDIDFGLHNHQHTSLFFGVVLIGLFSIVKTIYTKNKLTIIPIALLIVYCLFSIYISYSRQAWLALLITAFLFSSYFTIKRLKKSTGKQRFLTLISFFIGLSIVFSFLVTNDKVVNHVMKEKDALTAIVSLDFDDVPYSSFGIRLHSWEAATAFIAEKPIFGWGSNGRTLVIKHTEWIPENIRKDFGHLHNTYIEILVNYGVIGLIFYFYIWFYFSKQVYINVRSGKLEREIGVFYFAFLCFWTVMNCFEAYQSYWTGTFILQVILAGVYGRIWYLEKSNK